MGVITDLSARLTALVAESEASTIVYDRIDAINEDSKNTYPLILYRVVESSTENFRNTRENFTLKVDFFISDLHYQGSSESIQVKTDYLDNLLSKILKSIPASNNDFQLTKDSNAQYGWEQHNDNLIVVKRTITIQGFRCTTLIS